MAGVPLNMLLQGLVKAVPSGDTIVLIKPGPSPTGPPPEIRLNLASLRAPALPRPPASLTEEPLAFASREALRVKLVGQHVLFKVEYLVEAMGNRMFGSVFLDTPERPSVSNEMVEKGLVKIRRPASDREERAGDYDALVALEDQAITAAVGLHDAALVADPASIRVIEPIDDPAQFVQKVRGLKIKAIVEYVMNGSTVRALLRNPSRPVFSTVTLAFSGVQAPSFKRVESDTEPGETQMTPMPFALKSRFFTETRVLNRDVLVSIEGADRNGALFGSVSLPDSKDDIAELLLQQGLAKTASWSIETNPRPAVLRAAERQARESRIAVWQDYIPPANAAAPSSEKFSGKLIEAVSGDVVVVLDTASDTHRRINLASVRAPRLGRGGAPDAPYARQAKENLRKRLIGKKVQVKIEYERAAPPPPEGTPAPAVAPPKQVYATVTKEGGDDIALALLSAGLVTVIRHRSDEERAADYEEYLVAEKEAVEAKRGQHNPKEPNMGRINDMSGPDSRKRAKEMASFMQREGAMRGILEYASTGSRFRVLLSKDNTLINFALKSIRCPAPSRRVIAPGGNTEISPGEPFGDDAHKFTKENFLQREVEIDIQGADKIGTFLGSMSVIVPGPSGPNEKVDVATQLAKAGLGRMHEYFDPTRDSGGFPLCKAYEAAKEAKAGLWANFKEPTLEELQKDAESVAGIGNAAAMKGTVVEIGFGGRLFLQVGEPDVLTKIEGLVSAVEGSQPEWEAVKTGSMVIAKFQADGQFYRARILSKDADSRTVQVRFIDYGNVDWTPIADVKMMPVSSELSGIAPASQEISLRGIVVPAENEDYGAEAGGALRDLCFGKTVLVKPCGRSGDAVLGDVTLEDSGNSLAREMLKLGLGRVIRRKDRVSRELLQEFEDDEAIGRSSRRNLWRYGDAYQSDEDDDEETKARYAARRGGP